MTSSMGKLFFACLLFVGCATSGATAQKAASAAIDCSAPEIVANVQAIVTALDDVRSGVAVPQDIDTALINAGEDTLRCAIQKLASE